MMLAMRKIIKLNIQKLYKNPATKNKAAASPAAIKLYGFAYFKYFARSARAILDDIFTIPATGEVTSPNVPPVITAAAQSGILIPDATARGIANGMIKEAAPQPEPIK